jgi:hypothetical protein
LVASNIELFAAIQAESDQYMVCSDYTLPSIDDIITWLREVHHAEYCSGYGELGYHSPEKGIIFANWNDIDSDIQDLLTDNGYELEWSDEWYIDYDNDKAWRTSPDSHHWICAIKFCDGYVLTPDDDVSEWIEECENDHNSALPGWITDEQLLEHGYVLIDQYENGFHPGQNDDPKQIADGITGDYVFKITNVGQFDMRFNVYVRECFY